ncbi:hypothetical protein, partial [Sphingobium sp.]|uniref:hypothetical protein n=1 Tax=Sphingobium sp. TaxID=1912891 RepID=UPI003B3BC3B1
IGQIIPDRQQERFEHCQGRPSALTFGGQIKRIEKSRDRVPINQRTRVGKPIELAIGTSVQGHPTQVS